MGWGSGSGWRPGGGAESGGSLPSVIVKASGDATGVTDAANIQAAINSLRGIGGAVGLDGSFTISSGLTLYCGIGLVGQGPLAASALGGGWLTSTSAVTGPMITCVADPNFPTWLYMPYVANLVLNAGSTGSAADGIYIANTNGNIADMYVHNVQIFNCGGNGINCGSTSAKIWVDHCYFEHCKQNGLFSHAYGLRVEDSYFYGNTLLGVSITSEQYFQVANNVFASNTGGSFNVYTAATGGIISGNVFLINGTTAGVYDSRVQASAHPVIIADNIWQDTRGGTAVVNFLRGGTSAAVNVSVHGNTFEGSSGPAILKGANTAGDHYTIRDNRGYNDTVGQITNPISTANNNIGILGTTATAVASTAYTIADVDQYLVVSGGIGVSISILDPAGNTVESGLTAYAKILPVGWQINFGGFSVAPTVASFVT